MTATLTTATGRTHRLSELREVIGNYFVADGDRDRGAFGAKARTACGRTYEGLAFPDGSGVAVTCEKCAAAEATAPLAVVTLDGQEETVEVTATPAAEETTKAYRIGKLLREYVLSGERFAASSALREHIASRNVCYDGTATLRLTPAWAEELIEAASGMDAEAKAAARAARRTLYALFA